MDEMQRVLEIAADYEIEKGGDARELVKRRLGYEFGDPTAPHPKTGVLLLAHVIACDMLRLKEEMLL